MATRLYRTVKPSGGNYTTLNSCMAANAKDLRATSGSDEYFDVEIDGDWTGAPDTDPVSIPATYLTDATHYVHVYTTTAARHPGYWDTSKYILQSAGGAGNGISCLASFVIIDGLQIYISGTSSNNGIDCSQSDIWISNCLVRCDASNNSGPGGIVAYTGAQTRFYVWNCMAFDMAGTGALGFYFSSSAAIYVYNCTARNALTGFSGSSTAILWKNCGASSCGTAFSGGTQTTCKTTDPTFLSTVSPYNLHLDAADTAWKDQGTDLSGDTNRPSPPSGDNTAITKDIDGQTRSGSWDVGADEYVSGSVIGIVVQLGASAAQDTSVTL